MEKDLMAVGATPNLQANLDLIEEKLLDQFDDCRFDEESEKLNKVDEAATAALRAGFAEPSSARFTAREIEQQVEASVNVTLLTDQPWSPGTEPNPLVDSLAKDSTGAELTETKADSFSTGISLKRRFDPDVETAQFWLGRMGREPLFTNWHLKAPSLLSNTTKLSMR